MAQSESARGKCITLDPHAPTKEVHLLPCTIEQDGPAAVSSYFRPQPAGCQHFPDGIVAADVKPGGGREEQVPALECAFRGRQLNGATVPLPEGCVGAVLASTAQRDADIDSPAWRSVSCFSEVTYWNHGQEPGRTDPTRRAMDWLGVSQQVHAPIDPEQVDAALAEAQQAA